METQAPRRRRGRAYLIFGAVIATAVAIYLGFGWWHRDQVSTDNAQVEADVVPVSARVAGTVASVAVKDNQRVKAGEVLLEIDRRDLEVKLRQAEADLEAAKAEAEAADANVLVTRASTSGGLSSARAQLAGSSAGARTATAQIEAEQAALARATANLTKARTEMERALALRAAEAIAQRLERLQSLSAA